MALGVDLANPQSASTLHASAPTFKTHWAVSSAPTASPYPQTRHSMTSKTNPGPSPNLPDRPLQPYSGTSIRRRKIAEPSWAAIKGLRSSWSCLLAAGTSIIAIATAIDDIDPIFTFFSPASSPTQTSPYTAHHLLPTLRASSRGTCSVWSSHDCDGSPRLDLMGPSALLSCGSRLSEHVTMDWHAYFQCRPVCSRFEAITVLAHDFRPLREHPEATCDPDPKESPLICSFDVDIE
ncbi:hypothetical protein P154DRAFT_568694 [Amniculicola lignicola CBS 123094]|uniref:Uncharacterized protein n=1 Tax=Amniculicola lignicola CBS 123094 TaxID=1392246 RepID=A0A6A5X4Q0_9PLEO|nr:hypothetical protein P154DRAFT_568694 [Amniculicola lignicola CBS 123094]